VQWIANVVIGMGTSAIMESIFGFVGQYMQFDDIVGATLILSNAIYSMAPPYIIGKYIKQFSDIFIITESLSLGFSITVFSIILFIIWKLEKSEKFVK